MVQSGNAAADAPPAPRAAASRTAGGPVGEEFRLIADSAPVPMWVTELDRRRSFVNRAYVEFLGISYEEAVSFDWRTIIHPDDRDRILAASAAGEASLQSFSIEGRYRRRDGRWRWLRSVSQPRWDAGGRLSGFIGVAHDFTEAKEAEQALREREEQLSAFINQATAGFAQVDLTGRFTLVNDRFCEITGRSREELLRLTMQEITHPDDLPRNLPLFDRAVRDGTPFTHEKRYVRPDGSTVWVSNSVAVIRRGDGSPYGVLAVSLDMTARRRAESALRKSEESVRLAIEGAGMATWELDLATMEGAWSPNRFDILGYPRAPDGRGRFTEWLARIHPDDLLAARGAAERCFAEGTPFEIQYRILRADTGEERWLQSHGSRIDYSDDRAARFVGVSFDVTERKRAEQELRDSEWRFRTIFEQANDYIFTADLDQRVTSCNPAVAAALGYSEEEAIGRSFADFVEADQFEQTTAMLQQKLREGGTTRHTIKVKTRDGRRLIWEVNSRLTTDADGHPTGLHAIARDVTDAKRAEEHQRLLINELNHRVKNTLTIVHGIAQQSFKGDSASAEARNAFEGRLLALSHAHDLLTRQQWAPTSIERVLAEALAPHNLSRFEMAGPEVSIGPKTAISLTLAVHELATNATKYGALSVPTGRVVIRWATDHAAAAPRFRLSWVEEGGPAVVRPSRRGFGTRMIERGLAAELNGTVAIHFEPAGLRCLVDAPLPEGDV